MSCSDSDSTCSDLTEASVKSVAGSPVIQDLDIIMTTHSMVDDDANSHQMTTPKSLKTSPDSKTTQMMATNSSSASTAQMIATNSSNASASTAQILVTNSSSASASTAI